MDVSKFFLEVIFFKKNSENILRIFLKTSYEIFLNFFLNYNFLYI